MQPDAPDWLVAARGAVRRAPLGPRAEHRGRVEEIADSVAMISGLRDVRLDEVLRFQGGQVGFARVLDPDLIGCVLLDAATDVEAGQAVFGTGEVVNVPVGEAMLGRIVDPLGRPLDGKGSIEAEMRLPIERPAPSIIERDLVTEPVQTGIVAMDTLFALGRGQRELIVGDHSTGKTTLAVDALIAQRDSDMICVYVAVGQKTSSVRRAIDALQAQGDFARCIVLVAGSASAPGLQWIAPYAGVTMAEYFRDKGQHALVVIDDLSKHAATHREIALLTRQSPGREAYPGDVFYIHARLLERAAKLSKDRGGGSLTALPIAETDSGNLSAYIPTNLISITDGQIVLDAALFHQGQKPAIDVGLSVSRVGGKTQSKLLREAAGTLRLDYAQFLELEVFTRFGGMPEGRVRQQLTRGARIREILRQPQHAPFRLADEVALMLAVQSGLLDPLPLDAVAAFRAGLPAMMDRDAADVLRAIAGTEGMDAGTKDGLLAAMRRPCGVAERRRDSDMTERLAEVSARIEGIRQLGAVVNAMKGIAGARARIARAQVDAVDSYAATISAAMSSVLDRDDAVDIRGRFPGNGCGQDRVAHLPRRTGICRCVQRAGAGQQRWRARDGKPVPRRNPRPVGCGGAGPRAALERGDAIPHAQHPEAGGRDYQGDLSLSGRRPHRPPGCHPCRLDLRATTGRAADAVSGRSVGCPRPRRQKARSPSFPRPHWSPASVQTMSMR